MKKYILLLILSGSVLIAQGVNVAPSFSVAATVGRHRPMAIDLTASQAQPHGNIYTVFYTLTHFHRPPAAVIPGLNHNRVEIVGRHADGRVFYHQVSYNLITNAGLNWLADIMGATSTPSVNAQCNYIATTNTAITPAAGDTTLSGEISSNGLSRAIATYAHTSNATTFTLQKVFTATGSQSAQAAGVFTASSSGTMCYEDTFTQVNLVTNDTLTVTWTVTI